MKKRHAFTLPELLVATALTLILMAIVADTFKQSMDSFRHLKSTADLQQRLRGAETVMRKDLLAYHFETEKVSDLPPRPEKGYFRVEADTVYDEVEGQGQPDGDGFYSVRAQNYRLRFTVRKTGGRPNDYFIAPAGPALWRTGPEALRGDGYMVTPWAEIGYFLVPQANQLGPMQANGKPLFSLHRSERLLLPNPDDPRSAPYDERDKYFNVSYTPWPPGPNPTEIRFNDPKSVAYYRQVGINPVLGRHPVFGDLNGPVRSQTIFQPKTGAETGDDMVLTDVLNFHVQLLFDKTLQDQSNPGHIHANESRFTNMAPDPNPIQFPTSPNSPDLRSAEAPTLAGGFYDTAFVPANAAERPNRNDYLKVRAIKITIRIWDFKMEQARQVTIIQDL